MTVSAIIGVFVKIFFLLTPFFVLSVYVTLTRGEPEISRRRLAVRTTVAVLVIAMVLYLFGEQIFRYLGITLDAFRIGSGIVLLLSGIEVVRGGGVPTGVRQADDDGDISVVPLAIPYTVGPGTVGTLLVMGAGVPSTEVRIAEILGIIFAVFALGALLFFSDRLERLLKRKGLNILSKLTGLFLAALASQIIFEGVKNILES
ncbi:MarC family protein [uncultured Victivallis sp.]|uniref:MarC family protein n=1 Tax=uncultured Victivallis sp. TaxID=354118 RepID=UPI0025E050F2|nr:MarC family protein [uncultured Victivallis sp.]